MLTSQRREHWQRTKKIMIITQAERCLKKAAANDGNQLQAVCTKLLTLCTKFPTIWSEGSISATPRPTNTNEVSLESSPPAHSIHASLVMRSTRSSLHWEKRPKVTLMVILGWIKRPLGPFTCNQAKDRGREKGNVLTKFWKGRIASRYLKGWNFAKNSLNINAFKLRTGCARYYLFISCLWTKKTGFCVNRFRNKVMLKLHACQTWPIFGTKRWITLEKKDIKTR